MSDQPDNSDWAQWEADRAERDALRARVAELEATVAGTTVAYADLHSTFTKLGATADDLRAQLAAAQEQVRCWRACFDPDDTGDPEAATRMWESEREADLAEAARHVEALDSFLSGLQPWVDSETGKKWDAARAWLKSIGDRR